MRVRCSKWLAPAALLVSAAAAAAGEDSGPEMLLPGESAAGMLVHGDLREIALAGLEGVQWTIAVRRKDGSPARPTLALSSPSGARPEPGRALTTTAKAATIRNLRLDETGVWSAQVNTSADGPVVLTVSAKVPTRARVSGETVVGDAGGDAAGETALDLLPGSKLDLQLRLTAKRRTPFTVAVLAPDGTSLSETAAQGAVVRVRDVVADSIGRHRIVVRGGAGKFRGAARIRPAAPRRGIALDDFDALPVVTGLSPGAVQNGAVRVFRLAGARFSIRQRVELRPAVGADDAPASAFGFVAVDPFGVVTVPIDLGDVAPGPYASVLVAGGRRIRIPGVMTVSDMPPSVTSVSPPEAPAGADVTIDVVGAGFDPGATFSLVRAPDGFEMPFAAAPHRAGASRISARLAASAVTAGAFDLVVTDGGGGRTTFPAAFDLLGRRSADVLLRPMPAKSGDQYETSLDAVAYDEETNAVVVAITEPGAGNHGRRAAFLRCDADTLEILEEYLPPQDDAALAALTPAGSHHVAPSVAFHPKDRTWAMTWVSTLHQYDASGQQTGVRQTGRLRVARASSLSDEVASAEVAAAPQMTPIVPVADASAGGWLAVWSDVDDTRTSASVRTLPYGADGRPTASASAAVDTQTSWSFSSPRCVQRTDGSFVLVYGLLENGSGGSERRSVVRRVVGRDGKDLVAPRSLRDDVQTSYLPSALAASPDGSVLLAWTRNEVVGTTGGSPQVSSTGQRVRLSGADSAPGTVFDLGEAVRSMVWNPAREEYVLSQHGTDPVTGGASVLVRRFAIDGSPQAGLPADPIEGWGGGLLWSGPGSLGLVRLTDGVAGGSTSQVPVRADVVAVPMR